MHDHEKMHDMHDMSDMHDEDEMLDEGADTVEDIEKEEIESEIDSRTIAFSKVTFDQNWAPEVQLGEVAGVDTDDDGTIWVFHRGDRKMGTIILQTKTFFCYLSFRFHKKNGKRSKMVIKFNF